MDPFTEKLIKRTQERKEQLAQQREKLALSRSQRNAPPTPSPAKPRRPLSEDNTDSDPHHLDEFKKRRIVSDSSVPTTPTKPVTKTTPTTPRVHAKVQTTPKVHAKPKVQTTPKVQAAPKVPTTPSGSSYVRGGVEVDASPSIQARRDMLIQRQQKDRENNVTPKKHWKKALDLNQQEVKSPSVAARSAIFLNNTSQTQENENESAKFSVPKAVTPGKFNSKRSIFESSQATKTYDNVTSMGSELSGPPKPPRLADDEKTMHREKSSSKRKAPNPPTNPSNETKSNLPVPKLMTDYPAADSYDDSVVSAKLINEPIPAKRERKGENGSSSAASVHKPGEQMGEINVIKIAPKPRKRTQSVENAVDNLAKVNDEDRERNDHEERAKRKEERKKARMEKQEELQVVQAVEVTGNNKRHGATTDKPIAIQVHSISTVQKTSTRVKVVKDDPVKNAVEQKDQEINAVRSKPTDVLPVPKEVRELHPSSEDTKGSISMSKDQDCGLNAPSEGASRIRQTDRLHRFGSHSSMNSGFGDTDLNETSNDVNIHEMTFTFDFSNFDKITEDRENKFQKSFNETKQELEKEKQDLSPRLDDSEKQFSYGSPQTVQVEEKNMGVYKSGYNSESGDQYATKMYKKKRPPVPERPKQTRDMIKELLDEAASQQNIILQASQALNVCETNNDIFKGSMEEVEAERLLLIASERKQACLNEHHRIKNKPRDDRKEQHHDASKACTSTLSISGIRLSLKQEFLDVFRVGVRPDIGVFHFVCHVQNGPLEITSSKSLSIHDCTEGNFLSFPDKFTMKNLNPDFSVVVRIFGMHVHKFVPSSAAASTQKHKFFQSPKVAKNKRRANEGASHGGAANPMPVFRTSNFKLVGSTHITLPLVNSKKWSLEGLPEGCPLKETIQMKMHCMPQYTSQVKGFLTILEDVGGYSAWQRRWSVLEGGALSYWRYPGDEATQVPLDTLDLGQCTSEYITTVPRDLCARPHTMEVALKRDKNEDVKYLLACDTKEDRITWVTCLNDALCDLKAWHTGNKRPMYPDLDHAKDSKKSRKEAPK